MPRPAKPKNASWLMREAEKELKRLYKQKFKADKPRKFNVFAKVESYCIQKQWITRYWDEERFSLRYSLCNNFQPTKYHVHEIVEVLRKECRL